MGTNFDSSANCSLLPGQLQPITLTLIHQRCSELVSKEAASALCSRFADQLKSPWRSAWGRDIAARPMRFCAITKKDVKSTDFARLIDSSTFPVVLAQWQENQINDMNEDYEPLIVTLEKQTGRSPILIIIGDNTSASCDSACSPAVLQHLQRLPALQHLLDRHVISLDCDLRKRHEMLIFDHFSELAMNQVSRSYELVERITIVSERDQDIRWFQRLLVPVLQNAGWKNPSVDELVMMSRNSEFSINPRSLYIVLVRSDQHILESNDYKMILHRLRYHTGRLPYLAIHQDTESDEVSVLSPCADLKLRQCGWGRMVCNAFTFLAAPNPVQMQWLSSSVNQILSTGTSESLVEGHVSENHLRDNMDNLQYASQTSTVRMTTSRDNSVSDLLNPVPGSNRNSSDVMTELEIFSKTSCQCSISENVIPSFPAEGETVGNPSSNLPAPIHSTEVGASRTALTVRESLASFAVQIREHLNSEDDPWKRLERIVNSSNSPSPTFKLALSEKCCTQLPSTEQLTSVDSPGMSTSELDVAQQVPQHSDSENIVTAQNLWGDVERLQREHAKMREKEHIALLQTGSGIHTVESLTAKAENMRKAVELDIAERAQKIRTQAHQNKVKLLTNLKEEIMAMERMRLGDHSGGCSNQREAWSTLSNHVDKCDDIFPDGKQRHLEGKAADRVEASQIESIPMQDVSVSKVVCSEVHTASDSMQTQKYGADVEKAESRTNISKQVFGEAFVCEKQMSVPNVVSNVEDVGLQGQQIKHKECDEDKLEGFASNTLHSQLPSPPIFGSLHARTTISKSSNAVINCTFQDRSSQGVQKGLKPLATVSTIPTQLNQQIQSMPTGLSSRKDYAQSDYLLISPLPLRLDEKVENSSFYDVGLGLGISLNESNSRFSVHLVSGGRSAHKSGVLEGDILSSIDGLEVSGLSLKAIRGMLAGAPRTAVVLGLISRDQSGIGGTVKQDVALIRGDIERPELDHLSEKMDPPATSYRADGKSPNRASDINPGSKTDLHAIVHPKEERSRSNFPKYDADVKKASEADLEGSKVVILDAEQVEEEMPVDDFLWRSLREEVDQIKPDAPPQPVLMPPPAPGRFATPMWNSSFGSFLQLPVPVLAAPARVQQPMMPQATTSASGAAPPRLSPWLASHSGRPSMSPPAPQSQMFNIPGSRRDFPVSSATSMRDFPVSIPYVQSAPLTMVTPPALYGGRPQDHAVPPRHYPPYGAAAAAGHVRTGPHPR